jgi:protein TonB
MTRLHLALFTSLALHALGLMAAGTAQPLLSGQMRSSISVRLVGSAEGTQTETTRQPAHHPAERRRTPATPMTAKRSVAHVVAGAHNAKPAPAAVDTGSTREPMAGEPAADTLNRIKARLYTDLARHFDYPGIARQRGWEGRVMLAVNVASDGQLQQIRVARSSGFAILDDSALQSLRQVDRIGEAVALLNGRMLAMQIPVIYRLQGEP